MIDTAHIQSHESGPCSNPVLFGVALALVELFPLEAATCSTDFACVAEAIADESAANDSLSVGGTQIAA